MAHTRHHGPWGAGWDDGALHPRTPGPLGRLDHADPDTWGYPGDNPGPVGIDDGSLSLALAPRATRPAAPSVAASLANLTPLQFEARYHDVRVSYIDADTGFAHGVNIDVHRYCNNGLTNRRANMREKSKLQRRLRQELRQAAGPLISVEERHRYQIAYCFFGKASPEDFGVTLRHALRYGLARPNTLQHWCDETAKIGLDCSGFVNQYFMATGRVPGPRGWHISRYERRGTPRRNAADIEALDVLVWQGTSMAHIAVVDHVVPGTDPLQMVVVESSGSTGCALHNGRHQGLAHNTYTVRRVSGDVFRVDRGLGRSGTSSVKILEVPTIV